MLPKHFRWTVVMSVPRGTPDKLQQFRFYLHVCDSRHFRSIRNLFFLFFFQNVLDDRKSIGTSLYCRSVATSNINLIDVFFIKLWSAQAFSSYFHKMPAGGHFGFPTFSKIDWVLLL